MRGRNWTKGASERARGEWGQKEQPEEGAWSFEGTEREGQEGVGGRGSRQGGGGGGGEQCLKETDISKIKSKTSFNLFYSFSVAFICHFPEWQRPCLFCA